MNAYHQELCFELPRCQEGWLQVINTAQPAGADLPEHPMAISGGSASLQSRSLMLLVAEPLMRGHQH
jgi:hypothetical protein